MINPIQPASSYSVIVCSHDDSKYTALMKNLENAFSVPIEVIRITDARSPAEGCVRGLRQTSSPIVIFCRDDIELLHTDLDRILAEDLKTNDIVGVCGTSRLVSANWISAGHPYIHGQIAFKGKAPGIPFRLSVYGLGRDPVIVQDIQALDGAFWAVKKSVFSDLCFDEQLINDRRLCSLDFTFSAYLRGFKLSVDHRIMMIIHSDDEWIQPCGVCDRIFIKKHLQTIKELDARNEKLLQQTGENTAPFVKKNNAASKTALKQLMADYGAGKRLHLKHNGAELKGFDNVSIKKTGFKPVLAYPDSSLSYLCIEDVKLLHDDKIGWMNEFYRVCVQGSVLELKMQWHCDMGADREMLWKYHDFYCFDINSPGYCKAAKKSGFAGAFLLQGISSHANGCQRELKAIYQAIKLQKNIEWIEANHSIQKRESVICQKSTDPAPKFSIIVPHYQGTIRHEKFLRGIGSILDQTFQDFEILCYHDGPLLDPHLDFPIQIFPTLKRYNDWGHSLRDIGIHEAKGEYILHFNPDNLLYPYALEQLSKGGKDILIFPVIMYGMERNGDLVFQHKNRDDKTKMVLSGNPIVYGNIDCMQFVMKREKWMECGGWFDKRGNSDGFMYPFFAERYEVEFIGDAPLGEHW